MASGGSCRSAVMNTAASAVAKFQARGQPAVHAEVAGQLNHRDAVVGRMSRRARPGLSPEPFSTMMARQSYAVSRSKSSPAGG